jgi:hypothetical protein
MFRVLAVEKVKTGSIDSRLTFETDRGAVGIGNRFLAVDGKRFYALGIDCQTCSTLFQRLPAANQSVEINETAQALRHSIRSLEDDVVGKVGLGLPSGDYIRVLAETSLLLVRPGDAEDYFAREEVDLWGEDTFWCLPHDPRTPYYRAGDKDLGEGRKLFSFVVPMYPTKWLTMKSVSEYVADQEAKGTGTAVAIAVLDIKGPADWPDSQTPDPVEHWCLTHYLLDGHHKLHAAYTTGKPLRLLTFVALFQGVSTVDQVEEALRHLSTAV